MRWERSLWMSLALLFVTTTIYAQEARSYLSAAVKNSEAMDRFDVVCSSQVTHQYSDEHFEQISQRWRHAADFAAGRHLSAFKQEIQKVTPGIKPERSLILRSMLVSNELTADYDMSSGLRNRPGASVEYMLMLSDVLDVRLLGLMDRPCTYGGNRYSFSEWSTSLLASSHVELERQVGEDIFVVILNDFDKPWYRFRIDTETLTIERVSTINADGSVFRSIDLDWKEKNGLFVPVECRLRWNSAKQFEGKWKRCESTQIIRFDWRKCNEKISFDTLIPESLNDPKQLELFLAPEGRADL